MVALLECLVNEYNKSNSNPNFLLEVQPHTLGAPPLNTQPLLNRGSEQNSKTCLFLHFLHHAALCYLWLWLIDKEELMNEY